MGTPMIGRFPIHCRLQALRIRTWRVLVISLDLEAVGGGLMSLTTLNLPTEIPWERICVTTDMMAPGPRDLPGKWRSSIAVFKYVPDEDYQTYDGREISYLKVVVTVCGYQAKDK